MSGSCHLYRVLNVEIGVECQIFVIFIFLNFGRVLQYGAHTRHYMGALTQKRLFLVGLYYSSFSIQGSLWEQ